MLVDVSARIVVVHQLEFSAFRAAQMRLSSSPSMLLRPPLLATSLTSAPSSRRPQAALIASGSVRAARYPTTPFSYSVCSRSLFLPRPISERIQ